ncbi:MAG: LexA family protein [Candidatus Ornithospirochaeta sp.]
MKGPTERQKEIISFVSRFSSIHGYSPSLKEIGDEMGISTPAVHYAIEAMEKKGLLEKSGGTRAIKLPEEMRDEMKNVPIPFFSTEPDEATIERGSQDRIYVPASIFRPSSFAFAVTSWSMKEGGILPGDIAILDMDGDAADGDIVLAHPEGKEGKMELRRLRKLKNLLELWPENDSMGITRSQNIRIYGILREIRRRY